MADKAARYVSGYQPVPMNLFATWEVEKSSPNCIPRLCNLTLTRLIVNRPLENELSSLLIAVKMQNSKRVLRSNEILVPPGGLLDTDLNLSFSLQYPHFLKRDGNRLHVMLQRRKKYKNRTFLGFKTLAVGQVNMSKVLQCSMDRELMLYCDVKEQTNPVASLFLYGLTSQPVDHEINGHRKHASSDADRSPDIDNDSDDDDGPDFNDYSSNEDLSDSEPTMTEARARQRKLSRSKSRSGVTQRNIKQKFRALLKRFKISEDGLVDSEADHDQIPNPLDALFDELDDSDSGPELDTMSVMSTPKPKLRPFFANRSTTPGIAEIPKTTSQEAFRSQEETPVKRSDSDLHTNVVPVLNQEHLSDLDFEASDSQNASASESSPRAYSPLRNKQKEFVRDHIRSISYREKKTYKDLRRHRRSSVEDDKSLPRKALLDQLSTVFDTADDRLPDSVFMVNTCEWQGQMLAQKVQDRQLRLICTCTEADVKAAMCFLVTKLQKFCNSNARTPDPIKVGVVGGDAYINCVLRPFVEHFSNKSPDWQTYVRFLVVPFGPSLVGKYLASVDTTYASLFLDPQWKETFEKPESLKLDSQDIINRLSKYLNGAHSLHHVPIAEALVNARGRRPDEDSTPIFIPFLSEVRIGTLDAFNSSSVEIEESQPAVSLSSSPPASTPTILEKAVKEGHTPPNSPNIGTMVPPSFSNTPSPVTGSAVLPSSSPAEFMDLQVDYWVVMPPKQESVDKDKEKKERKDSTNKCSLKTAFRALYANRLPQHSAITQAPVFSLNVVTKEKKQKIMRIGKKGKELESKSQAIEGVSRMVCTSKSQNIKLKVLVDGVEWTGVKFFQLSSQWQTHVKNFPVAVFGASSEMV